jgi:hypothetical protein
MSLSEAKWGMARAVQVCYKVFLLLLADPVFFMLHANVDRLWDDWQTLPGNARKYGGSVNDALSVSISTVAHYGTQEAQDMFSIRDWCYSYTHSVATDHGSLAEIDEDKKTTASDTTSTQEPKPDRKQPNPTDTPAAIKIDSPAAITVDTTATNTINNTEATPVFIPEAKPVAALAPKTSNTTEAKPVQDADQENGAIRVGYIAVVVLSFIIML